MDVLASAMSLPSIRNRFFVDLYINPFYLENDGTCSVTATCYHHFICRFCPSTVLYAWANEQTRLFIC